MFRPLPLILALAMLAPASVYARPHHQSHKVVDTSWCQTSESTCLVVKSHQSWESLFPDPSQRGLVMRINHSNQMLYPGKMIVVPNNLDANLLDFSPLPRAIEAPGEKLMVFNPKVHAWGAYDATGNLVNWGPGSGGSDWCADLHRPCHTKAGQFRVYSLGTSACISTKFPMPRGGAPMPYCMYFNGGQAFHGSPGEVAGANISHGCVRMFVDDAKWLRFNFIEGPTSNQPGTKVIIMPY